MTDVRNFVNKLAGARVLLVGGTSGIGYAVAEGCLEFGCTVHVSSSNPTRVDKAVASLIAAYPSARDRIYGHVCGLGDKATIEANVIALLDQVGEFDHLVHTAGDMPVPAPREDGKTGIQALTVDHSIAMGMVRFYAVQMLAKHAVEKMPRSAKSSITMTSGTIADRPYKGMGWVAGTAGAVDSLARGLAVDLAPIRVNSVKPGPVETPLRQKFGRAQSDVLKKRSSSALTGTIASPRDTAEAYLYLLRDRSVTGTEVRNDSGTSLV